KFVPSLLQCVTNFGSGGTSAADLIWSACRRGSLLRLGNPDGRDPGHVQEQEIQAEEDRQACARPDALHHHADEVVRDIADDHDTGIKDDQPHGSPCCTPRRRGGGLTTELLARTGVGRPAIVEGRRRLEPAARAAYPMAGPEER